MLPSRSPSDPMGRAFESPTARRQGDLGARVSEHHQRATRGCESDPLRGFGCARSLSVPSGHARSLRRPWVPPALSHPVGAAVALWWALDP